MPTFEKKAVIFDWTSTIANEWQFDQAVSNTESLLAERADKSIEWPQAIRL